MGGITGLTTYPGGNMNTQVSGGPDLSALFMQMLQQQQAPAAPARMPKVIDPDDDYRRQMQQMQLRAMRNAGNRAEHSAAPTVKKGKPIFVKTVGGPGMQGGTIRLNAWEPGAAFAGYEEDLGSGPSGGSIQAPGASRAGLASSPANVPPPGSYFPGFLAPGAGGGDPDERPDWGNYGTTSARGQQAARQNFRDVIDARAQQEAMLLFGADPLQVYGGGPGRR